MPAYISLIVSFSLLAILSLWFIIGSRGHIMLKMVAVPLVLWYGLVVFYAMPTLRGWPTDEIPPSDAWLISFVVDEPNAEDAGGIYIWCNLRPPTDPMSIFQMMIRPFPTIESKPRAYRIPYTKEMHKKIVKAHNQQQQQQGSRIVLQTDKEMPKGEGRVEDDQLKFKIINPMELLPKEN